MKYKLLALDIDGTIVDENGVLSTRTSESIIQAQQRGIVVVLATGRRLTSTLPIAHELQLTNLLVVHNGAVVFDQNRKKNVLKHGIDLLIAQDILEMAHANSINYLVFTGESAGEIGIAPTGSWAESEDLLGVYLNETASFQDEVILNEDPIRISIIDRKEKIEPMYQSLMEKHGENLNAMLFGEDRGIWLGIEIVPGNCHKGFGLMYVADYLGINSKEVIAVGDNVNDMEMLAWAGLGIAMENATPELKSNADYIAPSIKDDGVSKIIKEFLL
ncbi:MAG: Cof-type HAD-IIB family hydrolase [Bacillota bacterium]|nr:Cof-type HAD-IIB family hydrolase [Bacillota bacterium]HHU61889.1 HAD family phosphatase [Natronincola sp.]